METTVLSCADPGNLAVAIEAACRCLSAGEVVGLPAETVYGLAGDALNPTSAARIFEAKARPFFDPLICHLPDLDWLTRMTIIPPSVRALVDALATEFWPGPLTMILPRNTLVPDLVCSGLPTVAVRLSAHPVFSAVARHFGRPLAAPSANRFGRISPTAASHVLTELGGRIPLILDAGPTEHGLESTIVAPEASGLRILRLGPITKEQLEAFAPVKFGEESKELPEAPGQLKSHYAPSKRLTLLAPGDSIPGSVETVGLLAWREGRRGFGAVEVLSASGDLREAAANVFAALRRLDEGPWTVLYAELLPQEGLGAAINERLRRAAARE
ncbi:MAG: L-threonylcarbamoyladenylate synthase [Verrucomicrobiota bacterium]